MFLHIHQHFDLFYTKKFLVIKDVMEKFLDIDISMVTEKKTSWKTSKITKNKISKKDSDFEIVTEKNNNPDAKVSVFTKTTNPKVIIQSDKLASSETNKNIHRHRILKSIYLIVMGIIVLITFFLSLKTYNIVNELYQFFAY